MLGLKCFFSHSSLFTTEIALNLENTIKNIYIYSVCIYIYLTEYVCVCIYMCIYMCVYIYIYIYLTEKKIPAIAVASMYVTMLG